MLVQASGRPDLPGLVGLFVRAYHCKIGKRSMAYMKTAVAGIVSLGVLAPLCQVAAAQSNSASLPNQSFFYWGGGFGANVEERNHFSGGGANATDTYEPGPVGIMNFGYGLGN